MASSEPSNLQYTIGRGLLVYSLEDEEKNLKFHTFSRKPLRNHHHHHHHRYYDCSGKCHKGHEQDCGFPAGSLLSRCTLIRFNDMQCTNNPRLHGSLAEIYHHSKLNRSKPVNFTIPFGVNGKEAVQCY